MLYLFFEILWNIWSSEKEKKELYISVAVCYGLVWNVELLNLLNSWTFSILSKTRRDTNVKFSDYFNHIVESIVLNFENRKFFFGKVILKIVSDGRLFRIFYYFLTLFLITLPKNNLRFSKFNTITSTIWLK